MRKNFLSVVTRVITDADLILEVVDARFPAKSRNRDLERLIKHKRKKLLIVINKSDLVTDEDLKRQKKELGTTSVFVSAKQKRGNIKLKEAIGKMTDKKEITIAVVGYPNTGKSSIINMLKGKKSAKTSSTAGFTKGMQKIRISEKIILIDTPGILQFKETDETLLILLSAKNIQQLKDLEGTGLEVAELVIKNNKQTIEKFYKIKAETGEEFLEKLALSKNRLIKGGLPDITEATRVLLTDFQKGKISLKKTTPIINE